MKHGKKYLDSKKSYETLKLFDVHEGLETVLSTAKAKFDETIEISVRLGVDPRHADQQVRGAVVLPHGTGKTVRVLVFAKADKAREAQEAGADYVGDEDLVKKIQTENWFDFDVCVATPGHDGRRRPYRPRARPQGPHAEPEERHGHDGRGQGHCRHQSR